MKGCRALTDSEVPLVLDSIQGRYALRDRALMTLAIKTGLRITELLSLEVQSVWLQGRILDRVHVKRRNTKRKQEGKTLVLHTQAKAALEGWIKAYGLQLGVAEPTMPLFPSIPGSLSPMTRYGAWRVYKRAFDRAKIFGPGLGTHVARKTFAAKVYEALDGDLLRTQKALGHRNINSTCAYLSFADSEVDAAIMAG